MFDNENESDSAEVAEIMNLSNVTNYINNAQNIAMFNAINDVLQKKKKVYSSAAH